MENPFKGIADGTYKPPLENPFAGIAEGKYDQPLVKPVSAGTRTGNVINDIGASTLKGVVGAGEAAVGLADIPTLGRAGKGLAALGYRPKDTHTYLDSLYSPGQQAANKVVNDAQGFGDTAKAYLDNPSTIAHGVVEAIPSMVGGLAIGRGLQGLNALSKLSPAAKAIVAGGAGEGLVTAGSNAEQIRQQTPDGVLSPGQSALALGSGLVTGAITGGAGKVANKLGLADINQLGLGQLTTGNAGLAGRVVGGGIAEAGQEAAQSAQDQVATNLALDKPYDEGVGKAAASGAILGGALGLPSGALQPSSAANDIPIQDNLDLGGYTINDPPPETRQAEPSTIKVSPATGQPVPEKTSNSGTLVNALHSNAVDVPSNFHDFNAGLADIADEPATPIKSPEFKPTHADSDGNIYQQYGKNVYRDVLGKLVFDKEGKLLPFSKGHEPPPQPLKDTDVQQETQATSGSIDKGTGELAGRYTDPSRTDGFNGQAARPIDTGYEANIPQSTSLGTERPVNGYANELSQGQGDQAGREGVVSSDSGNVQQPLSSILALPETVNLTNDQVLPISEPVQEAVQAQPVQTNQGANPPNLSEAKGQAQDFGFLSPQNAVGSNKLKAVANMGVQPDLFASPDEQKTLAQQQAIADLNRKKDIARSPLAGDIGGGELFQQPAIQGQQDVADVLRIAGQPKPRHTFSTDILESFVTPNTDGKRYNVAVKDIDSGEFFPGVKIFKTEQEAIDHAKGAITGNIINNDNKTEYLQKDGHIPKSKNNAISDFENVPQERGGQYFKGVVGGEISPNEKQITASGRETTPFPKDNRTTRNASAWLIRNALMEAEARGDDFNARIFKADLDQVIKAKSKTGEFIQQASKDAAEEYLFGDQPDVPKPFLKSLTSDTVKSEDNQPKPEKPSEIAKTQEKDIKQPNYVPNIKVKTKPSAKPTDELSTAIRKLGGIQYKGNADRAGFTDFKKDRFMFHNGKNAKTLDGMAESLRELGFNDINGENDLIEKLYDSLNGRAHYTPEGAILHMESVAAYYEDGLSQQEAGIAADIEDAVDDGELDDYDLDELATKPMSNSELEDFLGINDGDESATIGKTEGTDTGTTDEGSKGSEKAQGGSQGGESPKVEQSSQEEGVEKEPEQPKAYTLATHADIMQRLEQGNLNADEYKAEFERLVANKDAITAELNGKTKDTLLKEYPWLGARYRNEKKDYIVDAAYRELVKSYHLGGTFSYGMGKGAFEKAIRDGVEKTTDADLKQYSEDYQKAEAERKAAKEERQSGMENPQTIDDYTRLLRSWLPDVATFKDAYMKLTPEQREAYDLLYGEQTRSERKDRADQQKTDIKAVSTTSGDIIETKHTKTSEDLFVVKAAERVERDTYNEWNTTAKRLGGYYSSYRGGGAVPGFQFKTKENAEAFLKYLGGDVTEAKDAVQARRDAYTDDKSQSAVERLTEMADKLEERADEELGRERKANTAKRAREAASAEASAQRSKSLAKTMRNIAKAIDSGKVKFLDRVRQKVQVEYLQNLVNTTNKDQIRTKYKDSYNDYLKHESDPPTKETADHVAMPTYTLYRSDLAALGRQLLETEGTKKIGQSIMKVADDISDAYLKFAKDNLDKVTPFYLEGGGKAVFDSKPKAEMAIYRSNYRGKAIVYAVKRGENALIISPSEAIKRGIWEGDKDKRITLNSEVGAEIVEKLGKINRRKEKVRVPWQFENAYDNRKRLAGMGIENNSELRSAIREFIGLQEQVEKPSKIKEMERAMVGRRSDGLDFFPTPAHVAASMVEAADIQEGMSVLEPSAGMGHIAERIREAGVEPDVVELSGDRRELLEAKGFNVVGRDFMDINPREFFTWGDTFKAPDGKTGIMKMSPQGGMGSDRVALKDGNGDLIGYYNRSELEGVKKNGLDSGYDRILMNPPFSDRRDMAHVQHAYGLLKPGGRLVSIMGEGVFFGQDKKAQAFRDWLEEVGGTDEKLEEGTFKDPSLPVTTGVNARMVVIDKPDGAKYSKSTPTESIESFSDRVKNELGLKAFSVFENSSGNIELSNIIVNKANQNQGKGTEALKQLVKYADEQGKTIVLSPGLPNDNHGTTSRARLVKFYKRFGFVESKGRNVDYAIGAGKMYREPVSKYSKSQSTKGSTVAEITSQLPAYAKKMLADGRLIIVQSVKDLPSKLQNKGNALLSVPAWHGSPYDHDRFDYSKIGTGEGAQSFGYGLYFTDKKSIAEWYKGKLSGVFIDDVSLEKQPDVIDGLNKDATLLLISSSGNIDSAIKKAEAYKSTPVWRKEYEDALEMFENFDRSRIVINGNGKVYQVELAPEQDEFLDWDKPLSEQSEKVKSALKNISKNVFDSAKLQERYVKGRTLYYELQNTGLVDNDKATSDYLHSLGIRGIRYKAEGGKSAASNYVIFSDDDVKITAKYSEQLDGVEGLFDGKSIYLIADALDKNNLKAVLNHEIFHYSLATNPKTRQIVDTFNKKMAVRFGLAMRGIGSQTEIEATKRVQSANTPKADQVEEYAAYLVSLHNTKPESLGAAIKKLIAEFIAAIRVTMLKMGIPLRELSAADLNALALDGVKYANKSSTSALLNNSRAMADGALRVAPGKINQANEFNASNNESNPKFSIRQPKATTLSGIDKMLETGKVPGKTLSSQEVKDITATYVFDNSRPFDVWTRKLPNAALAGQMVLAKDRAKRRTAEFEKRAMDNYLAPLSEVIKKIAKQSKVDYAAAQKLAGFWMTARYALEKNQDYIRQDQQAVDEAQAALDEKIAEDKKALAEGKIDSQPTNAALKSALTKAKDQQAKRLAAINENKVVDPTLEKHEIGLAGGFNNKTAQSYMTVITAKIDERLLKEAAGHVYSLMDWKVKQDLKNGKVTQEMVDKWFSSPHYVPLTGDPNASEDEDPLFGSGGVNQQSDKKAEGRSTSLAQNGIDAAIEAAKKSAKYHGWKDFKDKLAENYYHLIKEAMDNGLNQREAAKDVKENYGISVRSETDLTRTSDSGIIVRNGGKGLVYEIGDKKAVEALKNHNREEVPSLLTYVANFTRFYGRLVTQFLPGFGVVNSVRDLWERSENIRTRILPGYEHINMNKVGNDAIKQMANPTLVKKLLSVTSEYTALGRIPGNKANNNDPDIKLIREMIAEGGTGTVGDYLSSTGKDLAKQMKAKAGLGDKAMEAILAYNNAFELVSSYAIYKALRKAGVDSKIAASGTLNLMNFGKRGTAVAPLTALYVFVNPTLQGGHQMVQSLSTNRGKARATAYLLAGMALYAFIRAGEDDDETGVNKIDELGNFILERNIPIKIGDGEYLKIPVGFGMPQLAWSTAVNIDKYLFGSHDAIDMMGEIMKSTAKSIAPVQPSETSISKYPLFWLFQTASPQIAKPITNIAFDINTFGESLTNAKYANPAEARALQGRNSTPEPYKMMSLELARLGVDMYPEQVREIVKGYLVGVLNEGVKAVIENPHKEKQGRSHANQLIDRFVAKQDSSTLKERLYYRAVEDMDKLSAKASLGDSLDADEQKLVALNTKVKKLEASAKGKLAAAAKVEKGRNIVSGYRRQGERLKNKAMDLVLQQY